MRPSGPGQDVEFIQAAAENLVRVEPAQFQETFVDAGIAQIGQAYDQRRRGVEVEHALEPLLGLERIGRVGEDEHQAAGRAFPVVENQPARAMDPVRLRATRARHLDHHVAERNAAAQPGERIVGLRDGAPVAVAQGEPPPVLVDGGAELLERGDAVHRQRGGVGPGDALVRVDE